MSVRSAVRISLPRNGLSTCRIIAFGITGPAMPAGIGLRIRFTCLRVRWWTRYRGRMDGFVATVVIAAATIALGGVYSAWTHR
jgi:hypothetical protein